MLEKMECVRRKTMDRNYGADSCSNSINNGNISAEHVRRSMSNYKSCSEVPARCYRVVDLMRMTLDKGVEIDCIRCEMQNTWSENVRLKKKLEAFSKIVPPKKVSTSEEDKEMFRQLEIRMAQLKNVNDDLNLKVIEKDKQIHDLLRNEDVIKKLEAERKASNDRFDEVNESLKEKVRALERNLSEKSKKICSLESDVEKLCWSKNGLVEDNKFKQAVCSDLKKEIKYLEEEIERRKSMCDESEVSYQLKIAGLESRLTQIKASMDEMTSERDGITSEKDEIMSERDPMKRI